MSNQGFTLIEMLVVVSLILTVVFAFTLDIPQAVVKHRVTTASYQLESIINGVQSCAVANLTTASVHFTANSVTTNCRGNQANYPFTHVEITTNAPDNQLTFNLLGHINQGATIDICSRDFCRTLTCSIGRSSVEIKQ